MSTTPAAPTVHTHEVLGRVEANLVEVRRAEFSRLALAREWALAHVVTDPDLLGDPRRRPRPLGAVGLFVDDYAAAEFAAALALHPLAGRGWMGDAVDLHDRLPHFWAALATGRAEVWVARKAAAATADLTADQARWVDARVAEVITTLPPGRLLALVAARVVQADQALAERLAAEAASARMVWTSRDQVHGTGVLVVRGTSHGIGRLAGTIDHLAHLLGEHGDPAGRSQPLEVLRADAAELLANPLAALKLMIGAHDTHHTHDTHDIHDQQVAAAIRAAGPAATRPRAILYLHLSPQTLLGGGVTRAEELGALTRLQLIDLLGHHQISVRPVIDLNAPMAADCYEVPAAIDERLQLIRPADVSPYANSLSRNLDRDHTVAYGHQGPPGQTTVPNLGKLARDHHRIKTHAGWAVTQHQGRFTWTTPHDKTYITDGHGTHRPAPTPATRHRIPDIYWAPAT